MGFRDAGRLCAARRAEFGVDVEQGDAGDAGEPNKYVSIIKLSSEHYECSPASVRAARPLPRRATAHSDMTVVTTHKPREEWTFGEGEKWAFGGGGGGVSAKAASSAPAVVATSASSSLV